MNSDIKRLGTREEVFKGLASRTAGGLKKDDIIEKIFGNRKLYISKKLSDRMRSNFQILKSHNPNFMKRIQKKTHSVQPPIINTSNEPVQPKIINNQSIVNKIKKPKTQKLSFNIKNNTVKSFYYPELEGMDIAKLKKELAEEEAIEDLGMEPKDFIIQEINDIDLDINSL